MTMLLDASAILAVIDEEPGAETVEEALDDAAISTVNVAEVAGKLDDFGWPADEVASLFDHLQLEILPFDVDVATILLAAFSAQILSENGLYMGV